jgi:hypothetical protein
MGRNGDTMLAHITPQEAMMLQRMGGSGTINPYTGLPEFFLKKMFKSIGKAVKKFAKSTVGRIVIGVALGAFSWADGNRLFIWHDGRHLKCCRCNRYFCRYWRVWFQLVGWRWVQKLP